MADPIRLLLVEDHALVRAGLRALLRNLAQVEVVAEAMNGREALRLIPEVQPTLVLMDIAMPGLNGLEALARITKDFPAIRVVILSMYVDEEHVLQAFQFGAAGYLPKGAALAEFEMALPAVNRGEIYLSSKITNVIMKDYLRRVRMEMGTSPTARAPQALTRLTPRQREILQLVAEGHSTKSIANLLQMKPKTVEVHRSQLMKRLDIHDTAGLVRYAVRHGLIVVD